MTITDWERRQIERACQRGLRRCGLAAVKAALADSCALVADAALQKRQPGWTWRQVAGVLIRGGRERLEKMMAYQRDVDATPYSGGYALWMVSHATKRPVRLWRNALGWRANDAGPYPERWQAVAVGWAIQRLADWADDADVAGAWEEVTAPVKRRTIQI